VPDRAVADPEGNPFNPKQARVGDFFAPFFTVRFLTSQPQQGTEVNPDTGAETTVEIEEARVLVRSGDSRVEFTHDPRADRFRNYMTSLTITNQGGGACQVELRMEPPLDDALVLIEQRLLQFNSIMVVEWGWSSNDGQDSYISDKHYFVTAQPKLEVNGVDVVMSIMGMDLLGYSASKRSTLKKYSRLGRVPIQGSSDMYLRVPKYDTDFKILEELAAKNKLRLNTYLAPPFVQVFSGTAFGLSPILIPSGLPIHQQRPTGPDDPDSIEQTEKDWVFFRRICEANRLDFFTQGRTIFLVDQVIARVKQQAAFRFVFFNQPQEPNDIPIYGFTTEALPTIFFPAESKEVVYTKADEDNLTVPERVIDPMTEPTFEMMGVRGSGGTAEADGRTINVTDDVQLIPNAAFTEEETGRHVSGPSGQSGGEEFAMRLARDAVSIANQNMEVQIPGVPSLCPYQIVQVAGLSKIINGPYLVMKVVHKLSNDGYDCDVTLYREASTGDEEAGRGQRPDTGGNDPPQAATGEVAEAVEGGTNG
jgi:hypothetical protein